MAKMGCGLAAVQALRAAGVTKIFGLMGSSTLEMYDALYDAKDMLYVGVRHENCGAHMADAYGRVTQTPGFFICGQAGPGAVNMVLGLAAAKMAYSPMVVITGLPASEHLGRESFQEIDQQTVFLPVTKRVMTVPRADRIPEFILEAFRVANAGRRGPVVVQIPRDLFNEDIDVTIPPPGAQPAVACGTVDRATLEAVKAMILGAKAPLIHAGAGIKWGRGTESLLRLAEKLQLPITTSAGHGDLAPVDHPLYAGGVGARGNPVASGLMREADVVLALGTRLGFNTTRYKSDVFSPQAKIVQVDIDPVAVGRYFPAAVGMVGDAGAVAGALADATEAIRAERAPWKTRNERFVKDRAQLWRDREESAARAAKPLHPNAVFSELRKVAPRDALFTIDAGTTCLQSTDQLPYHTPPALIAPLDCGNIGFSYAAGLGAKTAAPERAVISLMGDGGFGMTMGEMNTAVMHDIATVAIVMDNGTWGSEIAYQRDFYNKRYIGAHVSSPRFDEVMKLCGGVGYFATAPGEVADAVRQALKERKPAVVHVKVDPEAVLSFRTDALKKR
ncbi:MAG: thiamine pyrophosphate-binding protein [Betaproteobacteria bacterium]|nr:thiamine pyrophosphate-binding protein [Betaproteobacteria bacterium]